MSMATKLTSALLAEARSIADLQRTDFVTYQDVISALNEAYRDIYNQYTESDGDYFVETAVFSMSEMTVIPDTFGYQFEIELPANFYKVRAVGYNAGGQWFDVKTFSISDRNIPSAEPQYRIRNNTLWLKCISQFEIKLEYYIPPAELTTPDEVKDFLTELSDFQKLSIGNASYVPSANVMLYVEGTAIKAQSLTANGLIVTLATGTAPVKPAYYRGYVYYIEPATGTLMRFSTNLFDTNGSPASLLLTGVTDFSVFGGKIWYSDGANAKSANLDGTGSAVYGATGSDFCQLGNDTVYLSAGIVLKNLLPVTGITGVLSIASDDVYLYVLSTSFILTRYTIEALAAVDPVIMGEDFGALVQHQITDASKYLLVTNSGTATNDQHVVFRAVSLVEDTALDYPSTEVWELISYIMAVFFVRKNADVKRMGVIQPTLDKLWERFRQVNKRDENQVYRINDYYGTRGGFPGTGTGIV